MTQEEKELLIKDLSARLPYKVKASYYGTDEEMQCIDIVEGVIIENNDAEIIIGQYGLPVEKVKPYLFPISMLSMTEEQKEEYTFIIDYISPDDSDTSDTLVEGEFVYVDVIPSLIHFYHRNHLYYRGLIPKGLALDATGLNIY